ncbi:hypothetical protein TNIN_492091 [Trichonephila inaurata madagascariensis]|uniref:Uncharacterized protein n=1 Tax=Trichonephila inaurata madagascariensis TaxID=2747483 RepID=A0A8X6II56_9ARAC|nr:hypothetical protein TNIN_492091 [Trichonephila inaurata madagascariensis]
MINLPCRFLDGRDEEKQKKCISRAKKTDTTSLGIMNPSFLGVDYQRLQGPETLVGCVPIARGCNFETFNWQKNLKDKEVNERPFGSAWVTQDLKVVGLMDWVTLDKI